MVERYPGGVTAGRSGAWGGPGARGRYDPHVPDDLDPLLEANEAFYRAFEAGDLDAMSEVWAHGEHVVCIHPGWAALRGWAAVSASWFALFQGGQPMQFILTNLHAQVRGDVGWVTVDENLIAEDQAGTVAAFNLFERIGGRWQMVAHQGTGIAPR